MGWIRRMRLKNALFAMMFFGLLLASALSVCAFFGCIRLGRLLPDTAISYDLDKAVVYVPDTAVSHGLSAEPPSGTSSLPKPPAWALTASRLLGFLQLLLPILIFTVMILLTSTLFYRVKLKEPLRILKSGAEHIMENDLDFVIPAPPGQDELGQLCSAFEKMRETLLDNNQTLWRQAEERKRLNAAFAHDLRNPVTVLKGTSKLLRKGIHDEPVIDRLEYYTLRIEQYIESMSSIQRLEQVPVRKKNVACNLLYGELEDTVRLLAPGLSCRITMPEAGSVEIDHGLFMTAAENLIANGARYAKRELAVELEAKDSFLLLSVTDDGPGFPDGLIQNGPKPFGKAGDDAGLFGMGLYSCQTICMKHGGKLTLENIEGRGAKATAVFCSECRNDPPPV